MGAGGALPQGLATDILERMPLPVVAYSSTGEVLLNASARSQWPSAVVDPRDLPVTIDGQTRSLQSLHPATDDDVAPAAPLQVSLPGGDRFEVAMVPLESDADDHVWRVAILRPLAGGQNDGGFFADKVNRLKALVHEFRNTLTAAREALSFLKEGLVGDLNAEQRRFLDSALEDLEALGRAMLDLTSLWVTQAGVLRMTPRKIDIRRFVEQATLCTRPVAEKQGVSLHVEIEEQLPPLFGDHELLVQALRNVLGNALRHTSAGGRIDVRARIVPPRGEATSCLSDDAHPQPSIVTHQEEFIVIEVQDSGTGIKKADQERVFQPFERLDEVGPAAGTSRSGGMGLGLTIARDIASRHGATLGVRSVPGEGACFSFSFPRSETCSRPWMVRVTQQAIDDVRPLRASLAVVLLDFETDENETGANSQSDALSAIQQTAIENLRPTDTVLAVEGQLLMLIRGSTRSGAHAMIDRILQSMIQMKRGGNPAFGACSIRFGVATCPEDGEAAETVLECAEAELRAFQ